MAPVIFQSNEEIDQYRQNLHQVLDHYLENPLPFELDQMSENGVEPPSNLIYQGRDDKELKQKFAQLFGPIFSPRELKIKQGPRHIGFVVTGGHEGVFIKCMRGIIDQLSRDKFKVSVVCSLPNGEKIIRPAFSNDQTQFLSLPKDLEQAAKMMLNANFDILHYWEVGTDSSNYFLPYFRLAPVQCSSWGWPVTSGIPQMDYFISSEHLENAESESHYTEKLVKLKRLPVYYYLPPFPSITPPRSNYGLPEEAHIYLCHQNLRKVHPDFDELVKGILEQDSQGVMAFIEDKQPHITLLLKTRMVQQFPQLMDRVHFLKRMPETEYLGLLKQADVVLDTIHYTGGANTTYDAFAAGTPVVTWPGAFHRSCYTYAAYQQIGLHDCVVFSAREYIDKAVELGNNAQLKDKLGKEIKAASATLFQDQQAVDELSEFFAQVKIRVS